MSTFTRTLVTALTLLCVLSLGEAVVRANDADPAAGSSQLARELLSRPGADGGLLNNIAWMIATRADASRSDLEVARDAAAIAVRGAPEEASFIDTLATAQYRLGDYDRAVATQLTAVALDDSRVILSQLGRFVAARLERSGPMSVNGGDAAAVRVYADATVETGAPAIVVELGRAFAGGIEIVALDRSSGRLDGTLHIVLGPGLSAGTVRIDLGRTDIGDLRAREFVVGYVDAARCECESGTRRGRYKRMDPEVAQLP